MVAPSKIAGPIAGPLVAVASFLLFGQAMFAVIEATAAIAAHEWYVAATEIVAVVIGVVVGAKLGQLATRLNDRYDHEKGVG